MLRAAIAFCLVGLLLQYGVFIRTGVWVDFDIYNFLVFHNGPADFFANTNDIVWRIDAMRSEFLHSLPRVLSSIDWLIDFVLDFWLPPLIVFAGIFYDVARELD